MINAKIPALLIGTLMLLPTACMPAEEAAAKARSRCRPLLHRPESIDDLVVQMYRTALEDDCLYSMEAEELEQIWNLPVIYALDGEIDLSKAKQRESRLNIYIIKWNMLPDRENNGKSFLSYTIDLTDRGIEIIGTLFPNGRFPSALPKPIRLLGDPEIDPYELQDLSFYEPPKKTTYRSKQNDQIQGSFLYGWVKGQRGLSVSANANGAVFGNRRVEFFSNRNFASNIYISDKEIKKRKTIE